MSTFFGVLRSEKMYEGLADGEDWHLVETYEK